MASDKQTRQLELFFMALHGEALSVAQLAQLYLVSTKTISRDITDLKNFLADHRDLTNNAAFFYSNQDKCYHLHIDDFLSNDEMLAIIKIIIGTRALPKKDMSNLILKLKEFTTPEARSRLKSIIEGELKHYVPIHEHKGSKDLLKHLWHLASCIKENKEITLFYFKNNQEHKYTVLPCSLLFSEHYFYLLAYPVDTETGEINEQLFTYRVDIIHLIQEHRQRPQRFLSSSKLNENYFRQYALYMWSGEVETIRFAVNDSVLWAFLDKIPSAQVIDHNDDEGYTIVDVHAVWQGISYWVMSFTTYVRVLSPQKYIDLLTQELQGMAQLYDCQLVSNTSCTDQTTPPLTKRSSSSLSSKQPLLKKKGEKDKEKE